MLLLSLLLTKSSILCAKVAPLGLPELRSGKKSKILCAKASASETLLCALLLRKTAGTEKHSLTKSKILCANVTGNPRFAKGEPTELCSARRGFRPLVGRPVTYIFIRNFVPVSLSLLNLLNPLLGSA